MKVKDCGVENIAQESGSETMDMHERGLALIQLLFVDVTAPPRGCTLRILRRLFIRGNLRAEEETQMRQTIMACSTQAVGVVGVTTQCAQWPREGCGK
jgi:hypothetical protein